MRFNDELLTFLMSQEELRTAVVTSADLVSEVNRYITIPLPPLSLNISLNAA
jgi:hypothetical protein